MKIRRKRETELWNQRRNLACVSQESITQPFLDPKGVMWIFLQRYNLFAIAIYKPCMSYI